MVAEDLGGRVRNSWNAGASMHICFYEGWCTRRDVEESLKETRKLVREVEARTREGR